MVVFVVVAMPVPAVVPVRRAVVGSRIVAAVARVAVRGGVFVGGRRHGGSVYGRRWWAGKLRIIRRPPPARPSPDGLAARLPEFPP